MRCIWRILVPGLVMLLMLSSAGNASAWSYEDEDGDGICEQYEKITFIGDLIIIDENGGQHTVIERLWYIDDDNIPDKEGQRVTHTFPDEGTYTITLLMMNDAYVYIDIQLIIVDVTATDIIQNTIAEIEQMDLPFGVLRSLTTKLENAINIMGRLFYIYI